MTQRNTFGCSVRQAFAEVSERIILDQCTTRAIFAGGTRDYALDSSAVEWRCFIASTAILGAIRLTVIVPEPLQVTLRAGAVFFSRFFSR